MLNLIAAVARDGGLGYRGRLLFSLPEDLHRFKLLTMGKTVIMGRETLDSLPGGRPLPGRRNLVLTRNTSFQREGVETVHSVEDLLQQLCPKEEAWVMGGAGIYRLLLPLCSALYLTEVDAVRPADRYFPAMDRAWRLEEASDWREETGIVYRFCRYARCRE